MAETSEKRDLERHLQTGIAAVLIGLVGWIGVTITSMAENQAELKTRIEYMQADLNKLNAKVDGGMLPKTELEIARIDGKIANHEKHFDTIWPRLREMKERIQALEPKDATRWQF